MIINQIRGAGSSFFGCWAAAERVTEHDSYADERRLTEAHRPSVSRCPAHTSLFICAFLSLRSQPSRFLAATRDRSWRTQWVFNLPQTTASIKARKATTALCQRAGWGWWAELGGPCVEQGHRWWMDEGWAQSAQWKVCVRFCAWRIFVLAR